MEFNQLRCFLVVAQEQSITRAADRLYLTQSALSRIIARLENDLNASLFTRLGNRIALNENGRILQAYVSRGLAMLDDGFAAISGSGSDGKPPLIIRSELVSDVLSPICDNLQASFPQRSFIFHRRFKDSDDAGSRDADILLTSNADVRDMELREQWEEQWCVIIGKNHPLSAAADVALDDICRSPIVFYGPDCDLAFLRGQLSQGQPPPEIIRVEDRRRSAALINRGLSIACVPLEISAENLLLSTDDVPYKTVPVRDLSFRQPVYLFCRAGFPATQDEQLILRRTQQHFSALLARGAEFTPSSQFCSCAGGRSVL